MSKDLIYKEECFRLIGLAHNVYNELKYGLSEKIYQKAFAEELKKEGFNFEREKEVLIKYKDKVIGKYMLDFLINNEIIVELKVHNEHTTEQFKQLIGYLKSLDKRLGILILFTNQGIKFRRVVN